MLGAAMSAGAGGGLGGLLGQVGGVLSAPRRGLWDLLGLPEHGADLVSQGLGMERDSPLTQALGMGAEIAGDPLMWLGAGLGPLARMGGRALASGGELAALPDSAATVRAANPLGRFSSVPTPMGAGLDLPGPATLEQLNPGLVPEASFEMPGYLRGEQASLPYLERSPPLSATGSYTQHRPAFDPLVEAAHARIEQDAARAAAQDAAALEQARLAQIHESLFEPVDWRGKAQENIQRQLQTTYSGAAMQDARAQASMLSDALQDAMGGPGATLSDRAAVSGLASGLVSHPYSVSGNLLAQHPEHLAGVLGARAMASSEAAAANFIPEVIQAASGEGGASSPLYRLLSQGADLTTSGELPTGMDLAINARVLDPRSPIDALLDTMGFTMGMNRGVQHPFAEASIAQTLAPHMAEARLANPALRKAEALDRGFTGLLEGNISPMQARQTIDMARAHGLPVDPAVAMQHYQAGLRSRLDQSLSKVANLEADDFLGPAARLAGMGQDAGARELARTSEIGGLLRMIGPEQLHDLQQYGHFPSYLHTFDDYDRTQAVNELLHALGMAR